MSSYKFRCAKILTYLSLYAVYSVCQLAAQPALASHSNSPSDTPFDLLYLIYDSSNAPMQIHAQGELLQGGIITDIAKEIASRGNFTATPIAMPTRRMMHFLLRGELKYWVAYTTESWAPPPLQDKADLVAPHLYHHEIFLITRKDMPIDFDNLSSLKNQSVAKVLGFPKPWLEKATKDYNYQLEIVKSGAKAISMVYHKRATASFTDAIRAQYLLNNELNIFKQELNVCSLRHILPPEPTYLALDRRIPASHKNTIGKILEAMKAEGEIDRIINRYADLEALAAVPEC